MVPDMPVDLPVAQSRGVEDERNLSITLGSEGQLAIDRDDVAPGDLERRLRERLSEPGNEDLLVVVRADAGAQYARVGEILAVARAAGATHLAIATRQGAQPAQQLEDEETER